MNPFSGIEKLINEHGSAVILKERLDLAKDKYDMLEKEKNALAIEVEKLHKMIEAQEEKIQYLEKSLSKIEQENENFIDVHGVKIKRLGENIFDERVAYCFHCGTPLSAPSKMAILTCSKCGYKSSIQKRHLSCVISEAKGEQTPSWWKGY